MGYAPHPLRHEYSMRSWLRIKITWFSLVAPIGGARDTSPSGSIFIFVQFLVKSCQIMGLLPKLRGLRPRLGNSGSATGSEPIDVFVGETLAGAGVRGAEHGSFGGTVHQKR